MSEKPNLSRLDGVVAADILQAMRAASGALTAAGVPHALIGGLAVGAWGYVRTSRDVDFLVDDDAFTVHASGIVEFRAGVPIRVGEVAVDYISVAKYRFALDPELRAQPGDVPPVVSLPALILLKLVAGRHRDMVDIAELLDVNPIERFKVWNFIRAYAPELQDSLQRIVEIVDGK